MAMRDNSLVPGPDGWERPEHWGRDPKRSPERREHALRIGDAEREAAATELGDHFAAGRLTLDELHERLGSVLSARTHGQLTQAMADLPRARRAAEPPVPAQTRRKGDEHDGGVDHDARFAAVALLLLAMLIWLFTVLMFTRHGYYYHYEIHGQPPPPWNH